MEVIYQTPLTQWNPWNIPYVDRNSFSWVSGKCGDAPFEGWTDNNAYFTPAEFFEGLTQTSSADTASDNVCAKGDNHGGTFYGSARGDEHPVYASGHWITFPGI